jgi:hypothetical protein
MEQEYTEEQYTPAAGSNATGVDLSSFDADFSAAPEEQSSESVPDGKYQARIEGLEIVRAKTSGNPMLKWKLRIVGPTHIGRVLWRNTVLSVPENMKWVKKDLLTVGLRLAKFSDLPQHVHEVLGAIVEISKQSKNERENIFLNRRVQTSDAPVATAAGAEDVLPF